MKVLSVVVLSLFLVCVVSSGSSYVGSYLNTANGYPYLPFGYYYPAAQPAAAVVAPAGPAAATVLGPAGPAASAAVVAPATVAQAMRYNNFVVANPAAYAYSAPYAYPPYGYSFGYPRYGYYK